MVRSLWKRTLVASLAWAGMAVAQQPATDASRLASAGRPAVGAERVVTVQEQGKPGQRCKLIRSWNTADGAKAYQVQALDTGEMITVVESGPVTTTSGARPGTRMQAVATRIFHWGKSPVPPAGAPMPPADLVQTSAQAAAQPHTTPSWAQTTPATKTTSDGIMPRLFSKAHGQEATATTTASNCDPCDPCQPKQIAQVCPPCEPSLPLRSVQMSQACESEPSRVIQPSQPSRVTQSAQSGTSLPASPYSPVPNGYTRSTATSLALPGATGDASRSASTSPYTPMPSTVIKVPAGAQTRLYDASTPALPAVKVARTTPATAQAPSDICAPALPPMKVAGMTPAPSPIKTDVIPENNDWRKSWGKADNPMPVTPAQPATQASASKPAPDAMPVLVPQSKKPDPLESPEMLTVEKPARSNRKLLGWPKSAAERSDKVAVSSSEVTTTTVPGNQMPAGSGSVISAGDGTPGGVNYVPVPIVTMPDLQRPPMPPLPRLPQPPAPYGQPNMPNNMPGPTSRAPGPNVTTTDEGMVNAFTSLPSKEQVANATNAFGSMEPSAPMNPGYAGQPMMPQGYAMMGQGMPMANAPMVTAGYLPPPQGYDMMAAAGEQQMLYGLKDSLYPSQREWAVEGLATFDWHAHPEIVQALVLAAHDDPAATVRAACIRSLAKMNVNTLPVVEMVRQMRNDVDPRVRQEADQALAALGAGTPAAMRTTVQPAGSWTTPQRR
jgi:HEAT repeats